MAELQDSVLQLPVVIRGCNTGGYGQTIQELQINDRWTGIPATGWPGFIIDPRTWAWQAEVTWNLEGPLLTSSDSKQIYVQRRSYLVSQREAERASKPEVQLSLLASFHPTTLNPPLARGNPHSPPQPSLLPPSCPLIRSSSHHFPPQPGCCGFSPTVRGPMLLLLWGHASGCCSWLIFVPPCSALHVEYTLV